MGIFQYGGRGTTADIESLAYDTFIVCDQPVRFHYVLNMHVIPLQQSILKGDGRFTLQKPKCEDAGDAGILIE